MIKTIWKFPLAVTQTQGISMPRHAEILCVQAQGVGACIWARVDPTFDKEQRQIVIHGTGHEFEEYPNRYIGTFQSGAFVWHVFEALV
jgi:hypothetical protein